MKRVFIDSSVFVAASISKDSLHSKAKSVLQMIQDKGSKVYTSLFIVNETITVLRKVTNQKVAHSFYDILKIQENKKLLTLIPVTKQDLSQTMQLLDKYPTPRSLSTTDASCVILMKKHGIGTIATFDRDFKKIGVNVIS